MEKTLTRPVTEDIAYEAAKLVALKRLEEGSHLGGGLLPNRDELHDRARLR